MSNRIKIGDVVRHFKKETLATDELNGLKYLYIVKDIAEHVETGEKLVIYQALYPDENGNLRTWARPYDEFMSKVDKEKYPEIQQYYRFEKIM